MSLTPPLRAERIARWSLAGGERQTVLGDMHEEFVQISEQSGAATAERWYWRQTLVSILPNALRRFRNDKRRWVRMAWGCAALAWPWLVLSLSRNKPALRASDYWAIALILALGFWGVLSAVFGKHIRKSRVQLRARSWISGALLIAIPADLLTFFTPFGLMAGVFLNVVSVMTVCVELWPWWPEDPVPAPPEESFVRMAAESDDGKRHQVRLRVPNAPLGLSELILSAERNSLDHWLAALGGRLGRPTLRRRFSPDDTVRVYAAVNGARSPVDGAMDVIDAGGHIVQTRPVVVGSSDLEFRAKRADCDEENAPAQPQPGPVGKVEAKLPLAHLDPGTYRVRLTVHDDARSSVQENEFIITPPAATEG